MTLDLPDLISMGTWIRHSPLPDRAFVCSVCDRRRVEDAAFQRIYADTKKSTGRICRDCTIISIGNSLETLAAILQKMQDEGDDE